MYIQTIDQLGVIYIGGGNTAAVSFAGSNVLGLEDSGYATVSDVDNAVEWLIDWATSTFQPL
jgi:hypothetical protein